MRDSSGKFVPNFDSNSEATMIKFTDWWNKPALIITKHDKLITRGELIKWGANKLGGCHVHAADKLPSDLVHLLDEANNTTTFVSGNSLKDAMNKIINKTEESPSMGTVIPPSIVQIGYEIVSSFCSEYKIDFNETYPNHIGMQAFSITLKEKD
ncbi:MAG: hypothetical protein COA83_01965 [Methylophaga sp.]|nr:MAG: hypothetical protein COA83_01965 [Methylophaga sp.]